MSNPSTWIKIDRNILDWRWYHDANTFRVFIHLLLNANIRDMDFKTETIHRGELATSIGHIAADLGITYDQVRTAIEHLKYTNEITTKPKPKFLVITIVNYDKYQHNPRQNPDKSQANPRQIPSKSQQSKNKRNKELKKNYRSIYETTETESKPYYIPSLEEVREYERINAKGKDPDSFFEHYQRMNWMAKDKPIYKWQRLYDTWEPPRRVRKATVERPQRFTDADGITYELVNGQYEKLRSQ